MQYTKSAFVFIFLIYLPIHVAILSNAYFCASSAYKPTDDTRILLIGDPQLDGIFKLNKDILNYLDLYINDLSIRWTFYWAKKAFDPHYTFILGDLYSFEFTDADEFDWRLRRYQSVIPYESNLYNITGNHDVGYAYHMRHANNLRYTKHFGAINFVMEDDKTQYVVLNSMALETTRNKSLSIAQWDYVHSIPPTTKTRIVFVHIPTHPKEVKSCEGDISYQRKGIFYYQNYLSKNTTQRLYDALQPQLFISGHNHEGCFYEYNGDEMLVSQLPYNKTYQIVTRSIMGLYGNAFDCLVLHDDHSTYTPCRAMNFIVFRALLVIDLLVLVFLIKWFKRVSTNHF